jgi:hypothetical protein
MESSDAAAHVAAQSAHRETSSMWPAGLQTDAGRLQVGKGWIRSRRRQAGQRIGWLADRTSDRRARSGQVGDELQQRSRVREEGGGRPYPAS